MFPSFVHSAKLSCIMLCICAANSSGHCVASMYQQNRPANSYRTDLWDMEFHERDQKEQQDSDNAESDSGPSSQVPALGDKEDWGEVPGQVHLSDITKQTPFVEWKLKQSASIQSGQISDGPTAWLMSRVHTRGSGLVDQTPHSNGPSILTLIVAIVACMVMVGALFGER